MDNRWDPAQYRKFEQERNLPFYDLLKLIVPQKELAGEFPFRGALESGREPSVLSIEAYAQLLYRLGFKEQPVRAQVYPHTLESTESLVEWVKGSLLTYYQGRLTTDLYEEFLKRYRERVLEFFGDVKPMFLPFKHILLWARR